MLTANNTSNAVNTAVTGGTTVTLMAFFSDAMIKILPWLALAVPFLLLDLLYGVKAARFRGDKIRFSTGLRRSIDKAVSYIMWVAAAVMLSSLFEAPWLDKVVLGLVYGNEFFSIIGNYLEMHGVELSMANLWKTILRKGAGKVGVEISQEEADALLSEKAGKGK